MKLKRILAKLLAGAMLVTSIPASGIGAVTAFADVQPASQTGQEPAAAKTYRYRTIRDGVTASADGVYRDEGPVANLVETGDTYARSRYNTGGIPISTEFTANNNVYMVLKEAQKVDSLLWWTQNQNASRYGNVQPGTLTRYRVSVMKEAPGNAQLATLQAADAAWISQESAYAIFDTAVDDNDEHDAANGGTDRVAHKIDLKALFGNKLPTQIGAVRIEVLNTAGRYTAEKDEKDTEIRCNELELINGVTPIDPKEGAITPVVDFDTLPNQGASLLTDGVKIGKSELNDPVMQSVKRGEAASGKKVPTVTGDGTKLIDNNNLYFTLDKPTNIGRLTYMAGIERGTINECRIYVAKYDSSTPTDPSPKDASPKDAKDLDDDEWELVFSNVAEDTNKPGQTEKLGTVDGKEQTVWTAPERWSDFDSRSSMSWRHAHVAVFEQPYITNHVRIEVVRTQGAKTVAGSSDALRNKWISGKRVYLFEAQEVKASGKSIDTVEMKAPEPVYGEHPGRIELPENAPYTAHNMDWTWYKVTYDDEGNEHTEAIYDDTAAKDEETGEQPGTDLKVGAEVYRIVVKLRSKDEFAPYNFAQKLTINGEDVPINAESWVTDTETVNGEEWSTLTITHTFDKVADPTEAWQALKNYVTNTAKAVYDAANGNKKGTVDGDGVALVYTVSSWNAFSDAYLKAKNWTMDMEPDDPDGSGISGGTSGVSGPSGHTAKEYQDQLALLTKCLDGLIRIEDRRALPANTNVDVVAALPTVGGTIQNADLAHAGGFELKGTGTGGKEIVLTPGNNFGVSGDGYIRGKVTGAVADDTKNGNSIIKIQNGTNFLIHTKFMLTQMISSKQSIVGYFDAGYGLQMEPSGGGIRIFFYGFNTNNGWPETSYSIPAADMKDFLGKEHEIIAFHNGSKLFLYVDGQPSTDQRVDVHGGINCTPSTRFSIGWNADPTKGEEASDAGIDDFKIYIGEHVLDGFEEYKTENGYTTDQVGTDSRDKYNKPLGDAFDFDTAMGDQTPVVTIKSTAPSYSVTKTEWREINDDHVASVVSEGDTFKKYHDYTLEVRVAADDGYKFDKTTAGKLFKNQTEEATAGTYTCTVTPDLSEVVYTYNFKNTDGVHPYHALVRAYNYNNKTGTPYPNVLKDANGDMIDMVRGNKVSDAADAERKYTKATWQALEEYYNEVASSLITAGKKNDDTSIAAYETALAQSQQKAAALKLAAETCECVLKSVSPKDPSPKAPIPVDMGTDSEKDINPLDALNIVIDGDDCIMHKDGAAEPTYTYTVKPSGAATQKENLLTIKQTGEIQVDVSVALNGVTLEAALTYLAKGRPATDTEKNALTDLINDVKSKYPESYYDMTSGKGKALADAIKAAEDLLAGDEIDKQAVDKALDDINKAASALKDDTKAAAVANAKKAADAEKAKYEAGQGKYTDDSWKAYTDAYEAIANRDLAALGRLSATALEKLVTDLNAAKAGLTEKKPDDPNPPGPDNPNPPGPDNPKPPVTNPPTALANGAAIAHSSGNYKVKSAAAKTAVFVSAKNVKTVKVPATVTGSDGNVYKVVEIAKNAIKGSKTATIEIGANVTTIKSGAVNCKKLKTVIFKGRKLPTKMKKAFKNAKKTVTVKVNAKLKKPAKTKNKTLKTLKSAGIKKAKLK